MTINEDALKLIPAMHVRVHTFSGNGLVNIGGNLAASLNNHPDTRLRPSHRGAV